MAGDVYNVSGVIYGEDSKTPLDKVQILSTNADASGELNTYETTADGWFSIFLPLDFSTNQISIYKDGYWDIEATILNPQNINGVTLNLTMKPGFGKETAQVLPVKKKTILNNQDVYFGLFVNPFDNSPGSITASGLLSGYNLKANTSSVYDGLSWEVNETGALPKQILNASAVYNQNNDKYYVIAGKNADGLSSTEIYEYDRNDPANSAVVANLPFGGAGSASIYIPEKDLILMFFAQNFEHPTAPTGAVYAFNPTTKNIYGLGPIQKGERQQVIRAGDSLYLLTDLIDSDRTFFSKINLSDINPTDSCLVGKGSSCVPYINETAIDAVPFVGTTAYYSDKNKRIYLLGGKKEEIIQTSIYEIDLTLTNPTIKPTPSIHSLISPLAYAKVHKSNSRLYLYGGITTGNQPKTDVVLQVDENYSGGPQPNALESRGAINLTFPFAVNDFASIQDNSNRSLIFSDKILSFAPKLKLEIGQVYKFSSYKDQTLVFRGNTETSNFSYDLQNFDEANWQNLPVIDFANPYTRDISLNEITFIKDDQTYDLSEADNQGLISVILNGGRINQPDISLEDLSQTLKPGQYLSFYKKKNGVRVEIGRKVETNTFYIEIPKEISYEDIRKIAQSSNSQLSPEDKQKNALINLKIFEEIDENTNNYFLPRIYLTKNRKVIYTDKLNTGLLTKNSKTFAHAESQNDITFELDKESFNNDTERFSEINDFLLINVPNIKAMMGDPIFNRKIKIYNNSDGLNLNDGYFDESRDIIEIDFYGTALSQYKEMALIHEISHAWRGYFARYFSYNYEEGLAQGFVYAYNDYYNTDFNDIVTEVTNFDYWADIGKYYVADANGEKIFLDAGTLLREVVLSKNEAGYGAFFPQDDYFWTRAFTGSIMYKFFRWTPDNETSKFFKKINYDLIDHYCKTSPERCNSTSDVITYTYEDVRELSTSKQIEILDDASDSSLLGPIETIPTEEWLANKSSVLMADNYGENPFSILQYAPQVLKVCDFEEQVSRNNEQKIACQYNNKNIIANLFRDGEKILVNANKNFIKKYYINSNQKLAIINSDLSDERGVVEIDEDIDNLIQIANQGARILSVNYDGDKRNVFSKKIFLKNKGKGLGLFGVSDLTDGTELSLCKLEGACKEISKTVVNNGIFEMPNTDQVDGVLFLETADGKLKKWISKWKGPYQLDLITDTTNPTITSKDSKDKINLNLDEPSSIFVEYGAEKDKYDKLSFGKVISDEIREGDEVKDGDRSLNVEEMNDGQTYHYRIYAVDRSGNVSHADDLTFKYEKKEIKNIHVSDITSTSAKISWGTSSEATASVEYGPTASYGQTSSITNAGTIHSVIITGLTDGQIYHFRIKVHFTDETEDKFIYSDDQFFEANTYKVRIGSYVKKYTSIYPQSVIINTRANRPSTCSLYGSNNQLIQDNLGAHSEITLNSLSFCEEQNIELYAHCQDINDPSSTVDNQLITNLFNYLGSSEMDDNPTITINDTTSVTVAWNQPYNSVSGRVDYRGCNNNIYVYPRCTDWQSIPYLASYNPSITIANLLPNYTYEWIAVPHPTCSRSTCAIAIGGFMTPYTSESSTSLELDFIANNQEGSIEFTPQALVTEPSSNQVNYSTITQVEWGTNKTNLDQTITPEIADEKYQVKLPVTKAHTYYYRVAGVNKDGQKIYSETQTLKYGNWFMRFVNDTTDKTKSLAVTGWNWLKRNLHL